MSAETAGGLIDPVAFVRPGRPRTSNKNVGEIGERAKQDMQDLYRAAGGRSSERHRYGVVYYFVRGYRPATDADAGNVSKRVWDALEGVAYKDDHVVRLQLAGLVETGPVAAGEIIYQDLDLTGVPEPALTRLLELIASEERHFLYIELGPLRSPMFVFNLAAAIEDASS